MLFEHWQKYWNIWCRWSWQWLELGGRMLWTWSVWNVFSFSCWYSLVEKWYFPLGFSPDFAGWVVWIKPKLAVCCFLQELHRQGVEEKQVWCRGRQLCRFCLTFVCHSWSTLSSWFFSQTLSFRNMWIFLPQSFRRHGPFTCTPIAKSPPKAAETSTTQVPEAAGTSAAKVFLAAEPSFGVTATPTWSALTAANVIVWSMSFQLVALSTVWSSQGGWSHQPKKWRTEFDACSIAWVPGSAWWAVLWPALGAASSLAAAEVATHTTHPETTPAMTGAPAWPSRSLLSFPATDLTHTSSPHPLPSCSPPPPLPPLLPAEVMSVGRDWRKRMTVPCLSGRPSSTPKVSASPAPRWLAFPRTTTLMSTAVRLSASLSVPRLSTSSRVVWTSACWRWPQESKMVPSTWRRWPTNAASLTRSTRCTTLTTSCPLRTWTAWGPSTWRKAWQVLGVGGQALKLWSSSSRPSEAPSWCCVCDWGGGGGGYVMFEMSKWKPCQESPSTCSGHFDSSKLTLFHRVI